MNASTARQLALIGEIGEALAAEGISWWLFGGWGMDARAGRVTRDHDDIEFFVWARDASLVRAALERAAFTAVPGLHPEEGQPFLKDGCEVGAWFLEHDSIGRIVTPGRWRDWPWSPGSFEAPLARIAGVSAPAMSAEGMLDMKSNFARHPHGAPPRNKDLADIELLRGLLTGPQRP